MQTVFIFINLIKCCCSTSNFPTTTPAAKFAKYIASFISKLFPKANAIEAITVSPAPVTS